MQVKTQCFLRNENRQITQHSFIFDASRKNVSWMIGLNLDWNCMLVEKNGVLTSYRSVGPDDQAVWSCLEEGKNDLNLKFVETDEDEI